MGETNIFKVLADSQRRDILTMLKNGRLNAGEIAEELQITPAALSYHLRLLKSADLVSEYKEKPGYTIASHNGYVSKFVTQITEQAPVTLHMLAVRTIRDV